jgi:hypothetical protein
MRKVAAATNLNQAILNAQVSQTIQMDQLKIGQAAQPDPQNPRGNALHLKIVK